MYTIQFSFIFQWLCRPLLGPGLFFSFLIFVTQTVGLLGRVVSYVYDYTTKLRRQQADVLQNHENQRVCRIGQSGARQKLQDA
jgi:hypothetical protein